MKVINLYAGPGAGKSTASAALFVHLKNLGKKVELVGEVAKEFVYQGRPLENQVLIMGLQYARLKDLERHGCELAISDSPLDMQLVYAEHNKVPYFNELEALTYKLCREFDNVRIWISRTKPFAGFGRIQKTVEAAKEIDDTIADYWEVPFNHSVTGDAEGQKKLCEFIEKSL